MDLNNKELKELIQTHENVQLEFKESKTRLLHGNKLRQQIVGDYLRGIGIFRQIGIFDGLDT